MRAKLLSESGERTYALIFQTGDEPMGLLKPSGFRFGENAARRLQFRHTASGCGPVGIGRAWSGTIGVRRADSRRKQDFARCAQSYLS